MNQKNSSSWETCHFHHLLLHKSTPQELRSRIHSSSRMKRQLNEGGKKNQWKKINVKVVKAIPISSLIYGLLKCQRAFLSATFIFIWIDSLLMVRKQSCKTKKTNPEKELSEARGVFIVYMMGALYSHPVFLWASFQWMCETECMF